MVADLDHVKIHGHGHGQEHAHDHDHSKEHGHVHDHDRDHGHDHQHDHTHQHGHGRQHSHSHHHDHSHDHDHDHGHSHHHHDHIHSHDHNHGHSHDHDHDHDLGHSHDHDGCGCDGHSHSGWRAYAPHSHSLHSRLKADKQALTAALLILCLAFVVQLVGALIAHASVLAVESIHSLIDGVTVMLSLISTIVAGASATSQYTYGYGRSEILSALLSLIALGVLCVKLLMRALGRIYELIWSKNPAPGPVNGKIIVFAEAITLIANISMALMLSRQNTSQSLNIRAVRAHIIADSFENMVVLTAGILIWLFPKQYWIDPCLTVLVVALLFSLNWRIAREIVEVLMQAAPPGIVELIQPKILKMRKVLRVPKFHVWTLTTGMVVGTTRVATEHDTQVNDIERIRKDVSMLMKQSGVDEPCVEVLIDDDSENPTTNSSDNNDYDDSQFDAAVAVQGDQIPLIDIEANDSASSEVNQSALINPR